MRANSDKDSLENPEGLVRRLAGQLGNQALWDSLLCFSPPVLVFIYIAGYLYRVAWVGSLTFFLATLISIGIGLLAVTLRYRPLVPSASKASRLIDERAGAKDRFLTLATIDPSRWPAGLVARLRVETAGFLDRIELQRDFPYKVKKSFYASLIGSVLAALLFHLLLPLAHSTLTSPPAPRRLRELAEKMAERPRLMEIARSLQSLAAKLEDPKVAREEKQALIEETQKKVDERQKKEEQKDDRDLLGQAASTLKNLQQQSGAGQDQQENRKKGGGGIQSNLPQEDQGEGKPRPGGGGEQKGEISGQLSKDMQQGKTAHGDPKEQSGEKNSQKQGDGKGNQPDPNRPDPNKPGMEKGKDSAGKTQGGGDDKGGRGKTSEEIPQGAPPADRLHQAGEQGREGIKGARYVTVQLPEEMAAGTKGEKGGNKDAKGNRVGSKVPVSNVPLPAHVPDAPTETQQMPLEYRGIIR
ncbi:MAG: hypothetical protein HYV01_01540 [Deltaproteobacteria bacterium]|nr:hypothetical protein [Deltaproteobacteria bacterium]